MTPDIVQISELECYSNAELDNVAIEVSVSIRSNHHGSTRHGLFYMDLSDDSGDITAVAYAKNETCENHFHRLQPNRTYIISNFSLEKSNKRFTNISHSKEIVLNNESVIKLCGNSSKCEWPLMPLNEVYDQGKPDFFNIVGLCTRAAATEVVLGELTRQVTLVDEARSKIILNVWNQETLLFDDLDLNFHPVFFVKDAKIYTYRGRKSLTTSRYLQLLDPDDPRAAKIRRSIVQGNAVTDGMQTIPNADRTVARIQTIPRNDYPYCTPSNYTKKHQKYIKISELEHIKNVSACTLIATVSLISARYVRTDDTTFNMNIRDETGEMAAVIYDDACVKYQNFIEKNKTYSFTGFSLANPNRKVTSVPHKRVLILKHDGDIKLCGSASKVEWPLSPLTVTHTEDKMEFYQAFGLYTGKEGRLMTLEDQLGREVILQLCDVKWSLYSDLDISTRPVIFAKDAIMSDKKHKANRILMAGVFVELLEPDDPRALRITESLNDVDSKLSKAVVKTSKVIRGL